MELSRRRFFRGGAGVVAGVALGGAACAPALERPPGDLSDLDQHLFTSEVGSTFRLMSGPAPFTDLSLVEVDDFASRQTQTRPGEVFAAVFLGPKALRLPQELYRLEHPRLGGMSLLLVPVGEREEGFLYEALFNRQTA